MTLARFMLFLGLAQTGPLLEPFLLSQTTRRLFENSPRIMRDEFIELFSGQTLAEAMPSMVRVILQEHYIHPVEFSESTLLQMYNTIKANDALTLQAICHTSKVKGVAQIFFDF